MASVWVASTVGTWGERLPHHHLVTPSFSRNHHHQKLEQRANLFSPMSSSSASQQAASRGSRHPLVAASGSQCPSTLLAAVRPMAPSMMTPSLSPSVLEMPHGLSNLFPILSPYVHSHALPCTALQCWAVPGSVGNNPLPQHCLSIALALPSTAFSSHLSCATASSTVYI